jgi:hypothetical protein
MMHTPPAELTVGLKEGDKIPATKKRILYQLENLPDNALVYISRYGCPLEPVGCIYCNERNEIIIESDL